jgi:hypothetical protein
MFRKILRRWPLLFEKWMQDNKLSNNGKMAPASFAKKHISLRNATQSVQLAAFIGKRIDDRYRLAKREINNYANPMWIPEEEMQKKSGCTTSGLLDIIRSQLHIRNEYLKARAYFVSANYKLKKTEKMSRATLNEKTAERCDLSLVSFF